jgi:hypothetical protein
MGAGGERIESIELVDSIDLGEGCEMKQMKARMGCIWLMINWLAD